MIPWNRASGLLHSPHRKHLFDQQLARGRLGPFLDRHETGAMSMESGSAAHQLSNTMHETENTRRTWSRNFPADIRGSLRQGHVLCDEENGI